MAWHVAFPFGEVVQVAPTHVETSNAHFFVQLANNESCKLDKLMEEIDEYVTKQQRDKPLRVGEACLAKFEDDIWYRAKILTVSSSTYTVFFVDYGNTYDVDKDDILSAPSQFLTLPPQSFECELADVLPIGGQWSKDAVAHLETLLIDQTFAAEAVSLKTNNVIVLRLFQDTNMMSLVAEKLVKAGHLKMSGEGKTATTPVDLVYNHVELEENIFEDVYISHVENPGEFYCQMLKNSTALSKLMEDLDTTYSDLGEDECQLKICRQGNPCCARFSGDGVWYRAMITSDSLSSSGKIKVIFIDYGNSEDVHISNLKELDPKFLVLPVQALKCTLFGIQPIGDSWSHAVIKQFTDIINDKHLVSYVSGYKNNEAIIILFDTADNDQDMNISQVLVDSGNAVAVKPLDDYKRHTHHTKRRSSFGEITLTPSSIEHIIVTSADSPSSFYCQLVKNSEQLNTLMDNIGEYYESISDVDDVITLPQAGMLCCAKYTADDGWYRALIIDSDIAASQVNVLYVDYGNKELLSLSRIKELKPDFVLLPQQAVPCSLHGIRPRGPAWTDEVVTEFQNIALERDLVIHVVGLNDQQRYNVNLLETVGDDGYSINKQLIQKEYAIQDAAHPGGVVDTIEKTYRQAVVDVGSYIDVEITHVYNIHNFWCHLMSASDEMEQLMADLQHYYTINPPKHTTTTMFKKGGACTARYTGDNHWYRGEITEKLSDDRFKVHFVDYGNVETVTLASIAVIIPEFLQLPKQAIQCSLADVKTPEIYDKDCIISKFCEMVEGKELVCRVDDKDNNGLHLVLILDSCEGMTTDINKAMSTFMTSEGSRKKENITKIVREPPLLKVKEADVGVGEEIKVYVTSVTSPHNFSCQLSKTYAQLEELMNDIEEHYRVLGKNDQSYKQVRVGEAVCAMFTQDNGWYRAVVLATTAEDHVSVRYIDYGNCEDIPLNRIKSLLSRFSEMPAQSFQACLCGAQEEHDTSLEENILDQEIVIKILRKRNDGLLEIEIQDLKENLEQVEPPSQLCHVQPVVMTTGAKERVYMTNINSPKDFFCQLSKSSYELDQLMNAMETYYRDLSDQCYTRPHVGEACCAMFTQDNGWYRATVTKVMGETIQVCYLDYGNCEELPLSRVKILSQQFTLLDAQGFHASLRHEHGTVTDEAFLQALGDQEVMVVVVGVTSNDDGARYEVELYHVDGGQKMFSVPIPAPIPTTSKTITVKGFLEGNKVSPGDKLDVCGSYCVSPSEFYCQLVECADDLEELMTQLEEVYSVLGDKDMAISNPQPNMVCAAQYTVDDNWYRARILQVSSLNHYQVCFIDFGNAEVLPFQRLKALPLGLSRDCEYAVRCSLNGAQDKLKDVKSEAFEKVVLEQHIIAVVRSVDKTHIVVDLFDTRASKDVNILDVLTTSNVIKLPKLSSLPTVQVKPTERVVIESAESLDNFTCQLSRFDADLDILADVFYEKYSEESNAGLRGPFEMNDVMAAMFSEDHSWYRAFVSGIKPDGSIQVTFIDYGNAEWVTPADFPNRLRPLQPDLLRYPPMSGVQCALSRTTRNGGEMTWTPQAHDGFAAHVVGKQFRVQMTSSPPYCVTSMENEAEEIHAWLLRQGLVTTAGEVDVVQEDYCELVVQQGTQCDVYITSVTNPQEFYVQQADESDALENVMNDLHASCDGGSAMLMATVSLGTLCAAQYTEDEGWYRARVMDVVKPGNYDIMFVDYGNHEVLPMERLKTLDPSFLALPAQALCCGLELSEPVTWTAEEITKFEKLTEDKCLKMTVTNIVNNKLLVTLRDEQGLVVNEAFERGSKAIDVPQDMTEDVMHSISAFPIAEKQQAEAYISHLVNPSEFYVQLSDTEDSLNELAEQCASTYGKKSGLVLKTPKQGMFCCAKFSEDLLWYRSFITCLDSANQQATVLFVDHGNSETVNSATDLRLLTAELSTLPCQAIKCSLRAQPVAWTPDQMAYFENVTTDNPLQIMFKGYNVDTWIADVSVGEIFLNDVPDLQQAPATHTDTTTPDTTCFDIPTPEFNPGDEFAVYLISVDSPDHVTVQLSSRVEALELLMTLIAANPPGKTLDEIKVTQACLAQFSEDNAWYRARVVGSGDGEYHMRYVDYGNEEWLSEDRLADIPREFCTEHEACVTCELEVAKWPEDTGSKIMEQYGDSELTCKVVSSSAGKMKCRLLFEGEDVVENVLSDGDYGTLNGATIGDNIDGATIDNIDGTTTDNIDGTTTDNIDGTTTDNIEGTTIDSIDGPASDNIDGTTTDDIDGTTTDDIDGTTTDDIDGITTDDIDGTTTDDIDGTTTDDIEGTTTDDIEGTTTDNIDGTTADDIDGTTTDDIDGTTTDNIDGTTTDDIDGTTTDDIDGTTTNNIDGTTTDDIDGTTTDDIDGTTTDDIDGTTTDDIDGTMTDNIDGTTTDTTTPDTTCFDIPTPEFNPGDEFAVYLISVDSPDHVTVHLSSRVEALELLMTLIAGNPPGKTLDEIKVTQACLAQFSGDNAWYRARVVGSGDGEYHMRYVDYGNEEWLSEDRLADIPREFCTEHEACVTCELEVAKWPEDTGSKIMEQYGDCELTCKVVSSSAGKMKCRLLFEGEDVVENVLSDGDYGSLNGATTGDNIDGTTIDNIDGTTIDNIDGTTTDDIDGTTTDDIDGTTTDDIDGTTTDNSDGTTTDDSDGSGTYIEACGSCDVFEIPVYRKILASSGYQHKEYGVGNRIPVLLSHMDTVGNLWCQPIEDEEFLEELMDNIQLSYDGGRCVDGNLTLRVGDMCCCQRTVDHTWHRAVVLELKEGDDIFVRYVDYGETEVIPKSRVRSLLPEFRTAPCQATEFLLSGAYPLNNHWMEEALDVACDFTDNNSLFAVVLRVNHDYSVLADIVNEQDVSLGSIISDTRNTVRTEEVEGSEYPRFSCVQVGRVLELRYEYAIAPSFISCEFVEYAPTADIVVDELALLYTDVSAEEDGWPDPKPGDACAALFSKDDLWYRAEVMSVDNNGEIRVYFVDHGIEVALPKHKVKRLHFELTRLPKQEVRCHLAGVDNTEAKSCHDSITQMDKLYHDRLYHVRILAVNKDQSLDVIMFDKETKQSLARELYEAGFILKPEAIDAEDLSLPPQNDPSSTDNVPTLPEDVPLPSDEVPFSPEDLPLPADEVPTLPEDLPLPSDDFNKAESGREGSNGRRQSAAQEFCDEIDRLLSGEDKKTENTDMARTAAVVSTLVSGSELKAGEVWRLDNAIPLDEKPAIEIPDEKPPSSTAVAEYPTADIKAGGIHKVVITHIQSPSEFYCHLSSSVLDIMKISEDLNARTREILHTISDGHPCCVQSPRDSKWYRAVVTGIHGDHVDVFLVDYGETMTILESRMIYAIPVDMVTRLPQQALRCALVDLEPAGSEWSTEAVDKMKDVCAGKELEAIFRTLYHEKYDIYLRDPENDVADFVNKLLVDLKLAKVTGRRSDSDEDENINIREEINEMMNDILLQVATQSCSNFNPDGNKVNQVSGETMVNYITNEKCSSDANGTMNSVNGGGESDITTTHQKVDTKNDIHLGQSPFGACENVMDSSGLESHNSSEVPNTLVHNIDTTVPHCAFETDQKEQIGMHMANNGFQVIENISSLALVNDGSQRIVGDMRDVDGSCADKREQNGLLGTSVDNGGTEMGEPGVGVGIDGSQELSDSIGGGNDEQGICGVDSEQGMLMMDTQLPNGQEEDINKTTVESKDPEQFPITQESVSMINNNEEDHGTPV